MFMNCLAKISTEVWMLTSSSKYPTSGVNTYTLSIYGDVQRQKPDFYGLC